MNAQIAALRERANVREPIRSRHGGSDEAARVYRAYRWRGGGVALRCSGTAASAPGGSDFSAAVRKLAHALRYRRVSPGLGESGFIEGRNVEILYRWAETHNDRLPALAADLVRRRVAVIVATASPGAALAAKSATATIPIVFQVGVDPVEIGLVASISHPSGNLTGTSFLIQELVAKRLELLHQIVPTVTTIGFLVNPTMPGIETQIREAEVAARTLGVSLAVLNATTASEIEAAFAALVRQGIGALMTGSDALLFEHSAQVVALAARHTVPAIYSYGVIVDAGGLHQLRFASCRRFQGGGCLCRSHTQGREARRPAGAAVHEVRN